MRELVVVLQRELRGYFLSPIAYVFGGLFLVALGFLGRGAFTHGVPTSVSLARFVNWFPLVFLLFLPALSMRLWAEERKQGTLELLLTYPVRLWGVILGKFFAALVFLGGLLVLLLLLPLMLSMHGSVDWGPVVTAWLASLLMAGAYLSVGMFWSSLTRDQIVAMLSSLVSLLALFALGDERLLVVLPAPLASFVSSLAPQLHFGSIARGVLDTSDLVYYAAFCGFFLHANLMVLHLKRRQG